MDGIEPVQLAFVRKLLTSNQFRVGTVRKDGSVRAARTVVSLTHSLTIDFEVILKPGDKATLTLTRRDNNQKVVKQGRMVTMAEAAITNAHAAL
jgi:hypothetical protein